MLGLGHRYLNRPGTVLRYMNEAILPWYLLHQTLIVVFAFWLIPLALPRGLESTFLVFATVAGCALGYELVRRFWLGRLLFGLKPGSGRSSVSAVPAVPSAAWRRRPASLPASNPSAPARTGEVGGCG